MRQLSRRTFIIAAPLALVGCVSNQPKVEQSWPVPADIKALYGPVMNEPYPLPAVDMSKINPKYWRQEVAFNGPYQPGTLVVDTQARFLYLVQENGRALRYGVGVGKAGLALEGEAIVQYKRMWPMWHPTQDMMEREPDRYGHLGDGMPAGPDNPLGARALYLFKDGRDTLFRIHGSHEEWSIGKAVSSGCIRLLNQDIIDLYGRVPEGTHVIVLQHNEQGLS
ncbi:L,D-transpeptidase [Bartonella apis]|uniref:L,D-transpeptidase n=1 Tax=Bartonella apis TaxID=1686310 RepID=UPI0039975189